MELKRITVSALAAVFAVSGIGSILVMQHEPRNVEAVELTPGELDPAIRRNDDDVPALQVVDDDDTGDGDDTSGGASTAGGVNTGDGDRTGGDDGTSGGNNTAANTNTGDGDRTAGDDGTSGGNNTAANTNTDGDTGGGDTT